MGRYRLRPEIAVLLVAGFTLIGLNLHFWRLLFEAVRPTTAFEWLFLLSAAVTVLALLNLVFGAFAVPYIFKPAAAVLLLVSAAAAYFMGQYGTGVDAGMLRNVLETNSAEVRDLISPALLGYLLLAGALPAALLARAEIAYRPLRRELVIKTIGGLLSLAIIALATLPFTAAFISVFRENRRLLSFLSPLNSIRAVYNHVEELAQAKRSGLVPVAADAHKLGRPSGQRSLTVIVVGETARAANFSLNGYPRPTNPRLAARPDIINFSQAYSCGTDTANSLPCMFSNLGRSKFSIGQADGQENLLDVVQRAGVSVLWRENQAGCKGVCARVPTEVLVNTKLPKFYEVADALDDRLLQDLPGKIAALDRDGLFVLHMMGSHGPAYYKRYAKDFERFTPACNEAQFSRCTTQEIINAYDNSILYTDHILGELIELLAQADRQGVATAMIYVSDHGESLGERGLWLHAMPYAIAPDVQTHIPMLVWLSPRYAQVSGVNVGCVAARKDQRVSHDNFFHSVLGLLDIRTSAREEKLDIFHGCKEKAD
jgi:lipid A ethanolaminephosphotransferase